MMRTTLTLPDDVYEIARSLAHTKRVSIGEALADLVRAGLKPVSGAVSGKGVFPRFTVPSDAKPITLEHTLELEDET